MNNHQTNLQSVLDEPAVKIMVSNIQHTQIAPEIRQLPHIANRQQFMRVLRDHLPTLESVAEPLGYWGSPSLSGMMNNLQRSGNISNKHACDILAHIAPAYDFAYTHSFGKFTSLKGDLLGKDDYIKPCLRANALNCYESSPYDSPYCYYLAEFQGYAPTVIVLNSKTDEVFFINPFADERTAATEPQYPQ